MFVHFLGKVLLRGIPKAIKRLLLGFTIKLAPKASRKWKCHQWSTIQFLTWWEWQRSQNSCHTGMTTHWGWYSLSCLLQVYPLSSTHSLGEMPQFSHRRPHSWGDILTLRQRAGAVWVISTFCWALYFFREEREEKITSWMLPVFWCLKLLSQVTKNSRRV